ncbi:MAG: nitrate/nitrite transporter NrtS [Chloroflexi bacterium]|nr:nitrate/nitrite transporter NrtS [Chloroflexota bacterium]
MESSTMLVCERCQQTSAYNTLYLVRTGGADMLCCIRCMLRNRPLIVRSLKLAAVVGTILFALNQGDVVLGGEFPPALMWKIPLTYVTPFIVSLCGALAGAKR